MEKIVYTTAGMRPETKKNLANLGLWVMWAPLIALSVCLLWIALDG